MPRKQLYVPKESSFPIPSKYIVVARQTSTSLDNLEENSVDELRNIDGNRILSESWSGSTRFRILNKRPPQGYSWVGGRLTKTQVTSRPETNWPEVRSSLSKTVQKKAKQQRDVVKTHDTSCTLEEEQSRYSP